MERPGSLISVSSFKKLLIELHDRRPDICVRVRLLGEMWVPNFLSIFHITEKGALFNDSPRNRMIHIGDLSNVMQFEIDRPFQGFQPFFHYEVQPLLDRKPVEA